MPKMPTIHRPNRVILSIISLLILASLPISTQAQGPLDPTGPPGESLKTLQQVEPRIDLMTLYQDADPEEIDITVTESGSYYLSQDLPDVDRVGISVETTNVTIDLQGFHCGHIGVDARSAGTGDWNSAGSVTVRNGIVSGFGIFTAEMHNVILEDLTIKTAIRSTSTDYKSHFVVRNCAFEGNGIDTNGDSWRSAIHAKNAQFQVLKCSFNGGLGIDVENCAATVLSSSFTNCETGITAKDSKLFIKDCSFVDNDPGALDISETTILSGEVSVTLINSFFSRSNIIFSTDVIPTKIEGCTFSQSTFEPFGSVDEITDSTFENEEKDSGHARIYLAGTVKNCRFLNTDTSIAGGVLQDCHFEGTFGTVISSTASVVRNNSISGTFDTGIQLVGNSTIGENSIVSGNLFLFSANPFADFYNLNDITESVSGDIDAPLTAPMFGYTWDFPCTISLESDLNAEEYEGDTLINIAAANITFDLRGHSLKCGKLSSSDSVDVISLYLDAHFFTVKNGKIFNCKHVITGDAPQPYVSVVENVTVNEASTAFNLGDGARLNNVNAVNCPVFATVGENSSIQNVTLNSFYSDNAYAIILGNHSALLNSTIQYGKYAVSIGAGCTVENNVFSNLEWGITITGNHNSISNNRFSGEPALGTEYAIYNNYTDPGDAPDANIITRNTSTLPYYFGTADAGPVGAAATSTSPWANIGADAGAGSGPPTF